MALGGFHSEIKQRKKQAGDCVKHRQPRWSQEEAPILAASTQHRPEGASASLLQGPSWGEAEATKNDIQCQRLRSEASEAWGMRPPPAGAAVCPAGGAALLRVIGRFDISEVVIGVATFERGLGNCRLIYDCRAPR